MRIEIDWEDPEPFEPVIALGDLWAPVGVESGSEATQEPAGALLEVES